MMSCDKDLIYADNNATTPIDTRVREAMEPYLKEKFGNPNSLHQKGREASSALEESREKVASLVEALPEEIVFTGCATESNNQAILGTLFSDMQESKNKHIITTKIEHKSVLKTYEYLEETMGYEVTKLPVDGQGYVSPQDVRDAVREDTALVSIMMANNEIGTIEPIEEISEAIPSDVVFHTDAAQVPGKIEIDVGSLGVDLLTLNAHKMYGPKGVGALWVDKDISIDPLLHGGGQENGIRSGTESIPHIVGFGKAAEIAEKNIDEEPNRLKKMHTKLIELVEKNVEDIMLNGPSSEERLPGNANFSFIGVEGESIVLRLDNRGIMTSTGSACASDSLEPSYVLEEIGVSEEMAHSSLRIGLGRFNDMEDVEKISQAIAEEVETLRSISAV